MNTGLPARWAERAVFVVLQTGFGRGQHFLATWQAWRDDPARCERLFYVALLQQAPAAEELAAHPLADTLRAAWPPGTPGLHTLDFEQGRLQLLLVLGDVARCLPTLQLQADAFCIAGEPTDIRFAKALARMAARGASLQAPALTTTLHDSLRSAGFAVDAPTVAGGPGNATWAPRFTPRGRLPRQAERAPRHAVVVGAGIAGAAVAQALARLGVAVTVLEQHAEPAGETSGNPAGLFHGTVNADDGPYARLYRAAALQAQRTYAPALASAAVPGSVRGLLRLHHAEGGVQAMRALLAALHLPASYVQALGAAEASALAGVSLSSAAWHYPGGGWIAPAAWVRHVLAEPGISFVGNTRVQGLQREAGAWMLLGAEGETLARADVVVLAQAAAVPRLLAPLGHGPWPLHHSRGQVSLLPGEHALKLPVAGDGYALPLPGALLCGATREEGEPGDVALRAADHLHNLQRLQRLTGLPVPAALEGLAGRAGWRLHTDDRLPIAGAVPRAQMPAGTRMDQARLLPREAGLFVLTALGARGLTLAPLLARLVAAQATGTPWPLEQALADAVDPGRWRVRAARGAGAAAAAAGLSRPQPAG